MRRRIVAAVAVLALQAVAAGCASPPTCQNALASRPAPPPGEARLVLYMNAYSEAPGFWPYLTLDGELVGRLHVGTFLALDLPAGEHEVGVRRDPQFKSFGDQAETLPLSVFLAPGEPAFVVVQTVVLPDAVHVTLAREDDAAGRRDLAPLCDAASVPAP